jgi:hypothetical protein
MAASKPNTVKHRNLGVSLLVGYYQFDGPRGPLEFLTFLPSINILLYNEDQVEAGEVEKLRCKGDKSAARSLAVHRRQRAKLCSRKLEASNTALERRNMLFNKGWSTPLIVSLFSQKRPSFSLAAFQTSPFCSCRNTKRYATLVRTHPSHLRYILQVVPVVPTMPDQ